MATLFVFTVFLLSFPTTHDAKLVDCKNFDETCSLKCDSADICKGATLNCREGNLCTVECTAKTSCSAGATINAGLATDVNIICSAEDACKDNIRITCGTGHCKLYCYHSKACIDWGHIDVSSAASFQCIGYCPSNIPSTFGDIPTLSPTNLPTTRPIHWINNIQPTLKPPTNSPFTYFVVQPTSSPGINNGNNTDKKLSEILPMFDVIMWGAISLGICMACVAVLCLYKKLCKKRRKSIRKARDRGTISTTDENNNNVIEVNEGSVEYENNNEEYNHIISSKETPIALPMVTPKDIKIESVNSNAESVNVPLNQSESGSDYIGNTSGNDMNEMEPGAKINDDNSMNDEGDDNDNNGENEDSGNDANHAEN